MNFVTKIIDLMKSLNYQVDEGGDKYNLVYVEGVDANGEINSDAIDLWNDRRLLIQVVDGKALIIGNWSATTEPGRHYTNRPMNPKGAARVQFGQYKAWSVGRHGGSFPHESLIQVGSVAVCRDLNKDGFRTGDRVDNGLFGINQHSTNGKPFNIGAWSAGCLVGQSLQGHRNFMAIVKTDIRYKENPKYIFRTTILDGSKL